MAKSMWKPLTGSATLFRVGVEEFDCPAQSPDLNPIQLLWDELERRLWARPYHLTSWLTPLMLLWMGAIPCRRVPKSGEEPSENSGGCCSFILIPIIWEWHVQQAHIGVVYKSNKAESNVIASGLAKTESEIRSFAVWGCKFWDSVALGKRVICIYTITVLASFR